jgi:hypothetical protein
MKELDEFLDRLLADLPTGAGHQSAMREELRAHLLAVFQEERARLPDDHAAVAATLRRFGAADELNREIRDTVPRVEQLWHHLFGKGRLMRWLFLILGVLGFFVGAGFICPALAQLLAVSGVTESDGLHHYSGGFMIGLSIALLLLGCVLSIGGVWSVVHGVKQFRSRIL